MEILHLAEALTPAGWRRNVRVALADGAIAAVEVDALRQPTAIYVPGVTLPGLPNLHSHGFQRGMAGLAERRGPTEDSFWTWRDVMYRFLDRLTPEDVLAVTAQAYVEMLESGFTAVSEFHYVHHDIDGRRYAELGAMAAAVAEAARETGLGLTLLPALYRFGGFGEAPAAPGQRRFVCDRDLFVRLIEASAAAVKDLPDARWGVAPHSLRAVGPDDLQFVQQLAGSRPIHIHVAEQRKEVDDCLACAGKRPVELLFESITVDRRWCLIHATHLTETERGAIAASGAVAGLCPVTESSLGDGIFDGVDYREAGGLWGVGTDSNIAVGAASELRTLEYSQRLRDQRRARMANVGRTVGRTLYEEALTGGARACGRAIGQIAPGFRGDFITLDRDHSALAARDGDTLLDSAIFAAANLPIAQVRVGGRLLTQGGRHIAREPIARRYAAVMNRLLA